MSKKERNNLNKIKLLINKNKHNISRIVVSEEFLLILKEYADIIEIETKKLKMTSEHSFAGVDNTSEDYIEITYLFGVPCEISTHIIHGVVLEMVDGEFFVLKNI